MDNATMCHNFFYSPRRDYDIQSCNIWYKDNRIYSYNTCIGELTSTVSGERVLLVSDNNFSTTTTAKHIGILRYACPFKYYSIPQRWNSHQFNIMNSIEDIAYNLRYNREKLHIKNNREQFIHYYDMLLNTLDIDIFQSQKGTITTLLDEYLTLYKQLNNPDKIKEIKAEKRKKQKEEREKLKSQLDNILQQYSYYELVRIAYDYTMINDINYIPQLVNNLRKYLTHSNKYSLCWFAGEKVKTSQNVTVDKKNATTLLHLWQQGKLKQGYKISYYTVLAVKKTYVKIGCHVIPSENLQALCDELDKEKQAA